MATKKEVNLHHAMLKVMQEVKGIDKAMTVGSGSYSYKGVSDKDVKQAIGQAMAKNGLTCVPISIEPKTDITRWEVEEYGKLKQKMNVFVEVIATFRIHHADTSDSIDVVGYGHGQDTSDKAAGKATTYALKNALLYSFLVPTGAIDDTDKTHSDDAEIPPPEKPEMTPEIYANALPHILSGAATMAAMEKKYKVSVKMKKAFKDELAAKAKSESDATAKEGAAKMTAKSEKIVDPAPEAPKEEVVLEEKPKEKKAPAKKKAAPKKKAEPKVEEAQVVEGEYSHKDRILQHIASFTSSEVLLKEKNAVKLDMKLQNLTEEETKEIGGVFNEKYSQLIEKGL